MRATARSIDKCGRASDLFKVAKRSGVVYKADGKVLRQGVWIKATHPHGHGPRPVRRRDVRAEGQAGLEADLHPQGLRPGPGGRTGHRFVMRSHRAHADRCCVRRCWSVRVRLTPPLTGCRSPARAPTPSSSRCPPATTRSQWASASPAPSTPGRRAIRRATPPAAPCTPGTPGGPATGWPTGGDGCVAATSSRWPGAASEVTSPRVLVGPAPDGLALLGLRSGQDRARRAARPTTTPGALSSSPARSVASPI